MEYFREHLKMIRVFFAISIPEELREKLVLVQETLKTKCHSIKWVKRENVHLTLKFIGEIPEDKLAGLSIILKNVADRHSSFLAVAEGIGSFPTIKNPKVIWAGIKEGHEQIANISRDIEEKAKKIGFAAEEKPFTSHITIGRVNQKDRREKSQELTEGLSALSGWKGGPMKVNSLLLMSSILKREGSEYTIVSECKLKN